MNMTTISQEGGSKVAKHRRDQQIAQGTDIFWDTKLENQLP